MSVQRKRGQRFTYYPKVTTVDSRENRTITVDMDSPRKARGAFIPDRSSRAELPGQQRVEVYKLIVSDKLLDIDLWGLVEWRGAYWDVSSPSMYRHGTRQVRHQTAEIRRRPTGINGHPGPSEGGSG